MGKESEVDPAILEKLRSDMAMRSQTDKQISTAWVLVPIASSVTVIAIIAFVVETVFAVFQYYSTLPAGSSPPSSDIYAIPPIANLFAVVGYFGIIQFLIGAAFGSVVFLLTRRRNTHFARLQRLRADLIAALREIERARSINVEVYLAQAETSLRESERSEGEKSAILWGFMVFLYGVPYVGIVGFVSLLYSFYFLGRDWAMHDQRDVRFFQEVERAGSQLGLQVSIARSKSIPSRSGALYIIGAIFTLGIFEIYWLYRLITDPKNHLKDHAISEDSLLTALSGAFAASPP